MGLLSALGRRGMRQLQSGEMFGQLAADVAPVSRQSLSGLADRIAAGAYSETDVPVIRAVLQKAKSNWQSLSQAERAIVDQATITTRNRKMGMILNQDAYASRPEEPWLDLLD